jgi:hypothetical protein
LSATLRLSVTGVIYKIGKMLFSASEASRICDNNETSPTILAGPSIVVNERQSVRPSDGRRDKYLLKRRSGRTGHRQRVDQLRNSVHEARVQMIHNNGILIDLVTMSTKVAHCGCLLKRRWLLAAGVGGQLV